MKQLIDKLYETHNLEKDEFIYLLENYDKEASEYLFSLARSYSQDHYEKEVFINSFGCFDDDKSNAEFSL